MTTTLIHDEAERGLAGMDPARRSRHLARMSAEDLAGRYDAAERAGDQAAMAILDEAISTHYAKLAADAGHEQRAQAWRQTQGGQAYTAAEAAWWEAAHAQYLTAEAACPVLLSAAGVAAGREAFPMLWDCTPGDFDRWASNDLKRWVSHGELSITRKTDYMAGSFWTPQRREDDMETETGQAQGGQEAGEATRAAAGKPPREGGTAPGNGPGRDAPLTVAGVGAETDRLRAALGRGQQAAQAPGATVAVAGPAALLSRPAAPAVIARGPKIDGAEIMDQAYRFLGHFGVWPSDEARIAAVGHIAQSHMTDPKTRLPLGEHAPHWLNVSSHPGSGKTQLARVHAALCPGGRALVEVTKPALVQYLYEGYMPVIEETDVLFGSGMRNAAIRAIVNACFDPDNYTSYMHNRQKVQVPLFRSLILCGLDKIEKATGVDMVALLSRCHINRVQMAPEDYRPPRWDRQARAVAALLSSRFAAWMAQEIETGIADEVPDMSGLPGNRPGALWETALMAADRAGGGWPEWMRDACRQMESAAGLPGADDDASGRIEDYLTQFGITQGEEG